MFEPDFLCQARGALRYVLLTKQEIPATMTAFHSRRVLGKHALQLKEQKVISAVQHPVLSISSKMIRRKLPFPFSLASPCEQPEPIDFSMKFLPSL